MNYRHGFHAGNFADVLKHAVLSRILLHLAAKEKPFRVLDTHAGAGLYDLAGDEAQRTHEWRDGIARLEQAPLSGPAEALLAPWRAALAACRATHGPSAYPGSPWLARHALRPQDRLIAAELHPPTFARLDAALSRDSRCKALALDGWTALRANVPPKERRGLVLIDPPFEERDEFATLAREFVAAHRKWPTGIYALWYPAKDRRAADGLLDDIVEAGIGRLLVLELKVDRPEAAGGLGETGLLIVNPPWQLAAEAAILLPTLVERLAQGTAPRYRCESIRPDG
jgi:23S rRNA (adenine2030-N6)-methyltransferase